MVCDDCNIYLVEGTQDPSKCANNPRARYGTNTCFQEYKDIWCRQVPKECSEGSLKVFAATVACLPVCCVFTCYQSAKDLGYRRRCCNCKKADGWSEYDAKACSQCKTRRAEKIRSGLQQVGSSQCLPCVLTCHKSSSVWPMENRDAAKRKAEEDAKALLEAATSGNETSVNGLISKHADLFAQDQQGHTAMHLAAMHGHTGALKALAAAGGLELLQKKSNIGRTAHDYAVFHGQKGAEEVLNTLHDKLTQKMQELAEWLSTCEQRADQMAHTYRANYHPGQPLAPDEYRAVVYHNVVSAATDSEGASKCENQIDDSDSEASTQDKYVVESKELLCGEFEHAAKGFDKLLNVSNKELQQRALSGVAAILEEVKALGDKNVAYILYEKAQERTFANGVRDQGHAGMWLKDFVNHKHAKSADLEEAEVVALRLYTTSAFQSINRPLRDQARMKSSRPHPLPVTVMFIVQGIKKLRAIDANSDCATKSMVLWIS
jgi:hypothetical protein